MPKGKAYEYSPLALNYFSGCDHLCFYCFVPDTLGRWNTDYEHSTVGNQIDFRKIEASAKKFKGCNKQILLCFTGDPYCIIENGETAKVLKILNKYGHKVAILTKNPGKALKDLDIIKAFGNRIKVGTSLTFDNDLDSLEWEAGAPTPESRINGLKQFADAGVRTWSSFEPVIIPEQSLNLLTQVIPFVDSVKVGMINYYQGIYKTIDWAKFLSDAVSILRKAKMDDKFYIKKNLNAYNKGVYLSANETNAEYHHL
ncbi:MAG: radical SAM protein [Bacteroidales bacterium]